MNERYTPSSDFLQAVVNEEVPFDHRDFGEKNLMQLMAMTRDPDVANRDWATLLLSQLELNRPDVREALIHAASDESSEVRAEAILGLAQLDRSVALPLLRRELQGELVNMPLLEAAIIVADASLIDDLKAFAAPSANKMLDQMVADAITACCSTS
ncbi:MAG: HEAT repeat domain-containing protein [Sphingomonas sp.]|jgi:hypothetical protein